MDSPGQPLSLAMLDEALDVMSDAPVPVFRGDIRAFLGGLPGHAQTRQDLFGDAQTTEPV